MAEFKARAMARSILGDELLAYVLHLRPMEWPIMMAHFLLGTLLAVGFSVSLSKAFWGLFIFVVLMNGGTLAINSAFDQDEGDVGYLKAPPKPPKYLLHVSVLMLLISLLLGFTLPPLFAWSNALCVLMSVLYSVPPIRLKARCGWDLVINCLGFGLLTPLAGWGLTGKPVTEPFLAILFGFFVLFGALYPLTQIYQVEEDRARGDRTLVIALGEGRSLALALVLAVLAHGFFGYAYKAFPTVGLWMLLSLMAWVGVLLPWLLKWRSYSVSQHERGMYKALFAWAITDIILLLSLFPR